MDDIKITEKFMAWFFDFTIVTYFRYQKMILIFLIISKNDLNIANQVDTIFKYKDVAIEIDTFIEIVYTIQETIRYLL